MDTRVIRAAQALERLKELAGLKHRGEILYLDDLTIEDDKGQEAENVIDEVMSAFEGLACKKDDISWITENAIVYIKELGLPYPWLAMELIRVFLKAAEGAALGIAYTIDFWYDPRADAGLDEPAAPVEFCFIPKQGESKQEAFLRLSEAISEYEEKLWGGSALPPGKMPSESEMAALERYAYWMYLHRVRGFSHRRIAREAYTNGPDRRKDVIRGINRAEQLMRLTPYSFA